MSSDDAYRRGPTLRRGSSPWLWSKRDISSGSRPTTAACGRSAKRPTGALKDLCALEAAGGGEVSRATAPAGAVRPSPPVMWANRPALACLLYEHLGEIVEETQMLAAIAAHLGAAGPYRIRPGRLRPDHLDQPSAPPGLFGEGFHYLRRLGRPRRKNA